MNDRYTDRLCESLNRSGYPIQYPESYVRTYGRTYGESSYFQDQSYVSNARKIRCDPDLVGDNRTATRYAVAS